MSSQGQRRKGKIANKGKTKQMQVKRKKVNNEQMCLGWATFPRAD